MLTKVKICTSDIVHTSNGYYYIVMAMRTILCLIQGRGDPKEAYYRRFEAAILMTELAKWNGITHTELNKTYTGGDNEDGTKSFQSVCLITSAESYWYSRIWENLKNITLLGTDNYPKTTTTTYDILCRYKKPTPQRQVHTSPAAVMFVQSGDTDKNKTAPGIDGRLFPEVTCYHCQ